MRDAFANNLVEAFNFHQAPLNTDIIPLTQAELKTIGPYILMGGTANPNPSGSNTTTAAAGINGGLQFIDNDPD